MKEYIEAVQFMFGMSKKEAKKYCKEVSDETLKNIWKAFIENAKRGFYDD